MSALLGIAAWLAAAACSLKPDACLRMSDCADGFACVEGTCLAIGASAAGDAASDVADASAE